MLKYRTDKYVLRQLQFFRDYSAIAEGFLMLILVYQTLFQRLVYLGFVGYWSICIFFITSSIVVSVLEWEGLKTTCKLGFLGEKNEGVIREAWKAAFVLRMHKFVLKKGARYFFCGTYKYCMIVIPALFIQK